MKQAKIDGMPHVKARALKILAAHEAEHGSFSDVVAVPVLFEETLKLLASAGYITTRRDERGGPLFAKLTAKGQKAAAELAAAA